METVVMEHDNWNLRRSISSFKMGEVDIDDRNKMQQLKERKEKLIQLINRISKAENVTIETITDDYMEKAEQTTTIRIAWARDYGDEI